MATEKRLISADLLVQDINADPYRTESEKSYDRCLVHRQPTVDAIPVDEIKLHHVIIDNEGVPEVKLQIGDRYFILRTDPVDAVEVVHGLWIVENEASIRCSKCCFNRASIKIPMDYCPNCGAKMDGDWNG